jgi:hypothetical protein
MSSKFEEEKAKFNGAIQEIKAIAAEAALAIGSINSRLDDIRGLIETLEPQEPQPPQDDTQHNLDNKDAVFKDGFDGSLSPKWAFETPGKTWSLSYSSKIKCEGSHSGRFELRNTDPLVNDSKRCELTLYSPSDGIAKQLEEHWYGISFFLPAEGTEEWGIGKNEAEIITQWHNAPDKSEEWTMPPLSLHVRTQYTGYVLALCSDPGKLTTDAIMKARGYPHIYELPGTDWAADRGKWVKFVFHIKWGWLSEHNPIIEVWKKTDEVDAGYIKVLTIAEPNCMNDQYGPYWKIGIYKPQWAESSYGGSKFAKRVLYVDDVWMR